MCSSIRWHHDTTEVLAAGPLVTVLDQWAPPPNEGFLLPEPPPDPRRAQGAGRFPARRAPRRIRPAPGRDAAVSDAARAVSKMDKLSGLRAFVKVVEHGSFSEAARSLRLSRSAVSKYVIELERELGVQLLNRTTRSASPEPDRS